MAGSWLVDKAVKAAKPPIPISQIVASAPPAKQASKRPVLILRKASPIELVAEAQAVTMSKLGPLMPNFMEILPEAMFPMVSGTKSGGIRLAPFSIILRMPFSISIKPPIPELTKTPTRWALSSIL